jgi:hypothetical protein
VVDVSRDVLGDELEIEATPETEEAVNDGGAFRR